MQYKLSITFMHFQCNHSANHSAMIDSGPAEANLSSNGYNDSYKI